MMSRCGPCGHRDVGQGTRRESKTNSHSFALLLLSPRVERNRGKSLIWRQSEASVLEGRPVKQSTEMRFHCHSVPDQQKRMKAQPVRQERACLSSPKLRVLGWELRSPCLPWEQGVLCDLNNMHSIRPQKILVHSWLQCTPSYLTATAPHLAVMSQWQGKTARAHNLRLQGGKGLNWEQNRWLQQMGNSPFNDSQYSMLLNR